MTGTIIKTNSAQVLLDHGFDQKKEYDEYVDEQNRIVETLCKLLDNYYMLSGLR